MISITKGKIPTAKKVVIYGPEGIGKSTLASQFPDPVFIDCEGSTKELDVARYPAPTCYEDILACMDHAATEYPCKTLVIDTADWAEQFCTRYTCKRLNVKNIEDVGYGKGYTHQADDFLLMLKKGEVLIANGINVVSTAHAQMRKFEQPDEMGAYDRFEMKLAKKTAPLLKEWADLVLFCNYKTNIITDAKTNSKKATGGSRVMYTTHHPCWDAKNRYGLEERLDMDYANIAHLFPVIEKKAGGSSDQFVLTMEMNGISLDDVRRFSEYKGNFPGLDPVEYDDRYKQALMSLEGIEKIKTFIKENENNG